MQRRYSALDQWILSLHRHATARSEAPARPNPGQAVADAPLSPEERRHAAGLMRVNHAGEIAAQALYRGQAATARAPETRAQMQQAATEEEAHLAWCQERVTELGENTSRLGPAWFAGSFAIGALAGLLGDRWSLGFVQETERQVANHLAGHLDDLPPHDQRSRAIVSVMQADEERHGQEAADAGARELPGLVRNLMRRVARVMTRTAYWI